jgi:hypothetical protein
MKSTRVYVGNLAFQVTQEELDEYVRRVAAPVNVNLMMFNGRSKGFFTHFPLILLERFVIIIPFDALGLQYF